MARTITNQTQRRADELRSRKLRDIHELIAKPYPGIKLHIKDDNLEKACLILSPEGERSLHLRITFPDTYPLEPPQVTIQSQIIHPNVFGDYVCATILNDEEAYTSAYTLKSICIQLLSFFSDDRIESAETGGMIDVKGYRERVREHYGGFGGGYRGAGAAAHVHVCNDCGFGVAGAPSVINPTTKAPVLEQERIPVGCPIDTIAFDVLLLICDELDTDDLVVASKAWAGFSAALHALVPIRNLQCFTLKKGTRDVNLGVGVKVNREGLSCEFDLISDVAFNSLRVRQSIHGLPFEHWLPLALNARHWSRVRGRLLHDSLSGIQRDMHKNLPLVNVLYTLMNDVVVKLSDKAKDSKSTLAHASEKAVESYFALFQLLICMALEDPSIVTAARKAVDDFMAGNHNKNVVPNLGQFLIARLLSDAARGASQTSEQREGVTIEIVKEAIVRNVVWMLSSHNNRVGGKAGLAYLEPSAFSPYRLVHTYQASTTSYRLLMFQDLMRRTVLLTYGGKSLEQIRTELFSRHGAPPDGAAAQLTAEIKAIQAVENFPGFFKALDLTQTPSKERFTDFLRRSIQMSHDAGYSREALTQGEALFLRKRHEHEVEVAGGVMQKYHHGKASFFPDEGRRGRR